MATLEDLASYNSDEDKELLLSRVNQLVFVDGAAGFACGRCDRTLIKHYKANCGHFFCANCKRVLTVSKSNCPVAHCNQPIRELDFQDIEFERKLYDLRAHCPNKNYGCAFISQLKNLGGHLRVCKDTKDNALPVLIEENRVEKILRDLSDKFDKLSEDVSKLDNSLNQMDRKITESNAKILKLAERTRNDQSEIVKINDNLERKVINLERKVFALENFDQLRHPQVNCFTVVDENSNLQPDFTWKIQINNLAYIRSTIFGWTGYPVHSRANLRVQEDGQVYVFLSLEEPSIELTRIPRVYYVLKDRISESGPKHKSRTMGYTFASKFNSTFEFGTCLCLKSHLTESPYNAQDSVTIEIYVEPPTTAQSVHSYDGTLHWAIENYRQRKRMERDYLVWFYESPYFYTGPRGYRVQVVVWLDGWGEHEGKGPTVQVVFLAGEFDDDLSENFPHKTTITIFNRKDPRRNIVKSVVKELGREAYYFVNMGEDEEIEHLIENDVIFFKVTIKPSINDCKL